MTSFSRGDSLLESVQVFLSHNLQVFTSFHCFLHIFLLSFRALLFHFFHFNIWVTTIFLPFLNIPITRNCLRLCAPLHWLWLLTGSRRRRTFSFTTFLNSLTWVLTLNRRMTIPFLSLRSVIRPLKAAKRRPLVSCYWQICLSSMFAVKEWRGEKKMTNDFLLLADSTCHC